MDLDLHIQTNTLNLFYKKGQGPKLKRIQMLINHIEYYGI